MLLRLLMPCSWFHMLFPTPWEIVPLKKQHHACLSAGPLSCNFELRARTLLAQAMAESGPSWTT